MRRPEDNTLTLSSPALEYLMRAVLEKDGHFRFCARGTSMIPFVRDGDIVTIAPLTGQPPRLGEVVAFCRQVWGPRPVVHRVVGKDPAGLVIQGDGNGCEPEIVALEDVLGRLVKLERNGRSIHLGLGPERRVLAWLSRSRLIWKWVWPLWSRVRLLFKTSESQA